jgi:hypothetical protein
VSDEVKVGIKNSRMGNYNMRLSDHILLLNWNSSSTALLRQIASAYSDGGMYNNGRLFFTNRPPVVVLADKVKADMDAAVHEMLRLVIPSPWINPDPWTIPACHSGSGGCPPHTGWGWGAHSGVVHSPLAAVPSL